MILIIHRESLMISIGVSIKVGFQLLKAIIVYVDNTSIFDPKFCQVPYQLSDFEFTREFQ